MNPDGTVPVNILTPTSPVGLLGADGTLNAVLATGLVPCGQQHPSGALWVTVGNEPSRLAPDGSLYVMQAGAGYALLTDRSWIIGEDFVNSLYWPRSIAAELVDTRTSSAYAADASGVWSNFLSTELRITNAGLTNEPTRTNSILNNSMQGAVAGSPGTMPTNWAIGVPTGLTRTITLSTVNGVECVSIRYNGTTTSSAQCLFYTDLGAPAVQGQAWTVSEFFSLTQTASVINSITNYIQEFNSVGGVVGGGPGPEFTVVGSLLRRAFTRTVGAAATASIRPVIVTNQILSGTAVDFTITIGWPQLERVPSVSSIASSPIRTTNAAITRAADVITIQRTGIGRVVFTFDDNSQQTITGIDTGAQYTIPTNLNRSVIKRIMGYAS